MENKYKFAATFQTEDLFSLSKNANVQPFVNKG
jgi:hypothetical protein